jgi:hypothetical protein
MNCRAFRASHGDWVDDVLDPASAPRLTQHIGECEACARFDTLARRALMVARNMPQLEVSADFSSRLAARIADERRARISAHAPSRAERTPLWRIASPVWTRRVAAVAVVVGGSAAMRTAFTAPQTAGWSAAGAATFEAAQPAAAFAPASIPDENYQALPAALRGEIVVVTAMRQVGGAILPLSDDPLLDDAAYGRMRDAIATPVAATAPLWPTAQMAAHAANRFAAMEFGDVVPVTAVQSAR